MRKAVESEIVKQLTGVLKVPVKAYPQNASNYYMTQPIGEVLVRYTGKKAEKQDLTRSLLTDKVQVEIVCVFKQLRETNGLYETLSKIEETLTGLKVIDGGEPLEFVSEDFLDEYNGTWQYGQKWEFEYNHCVQYAEEEDLLFLKKVKSNLDG